MLGQAATGTGKTAAFALPMLQRLVEDDSREEADRRPGARADARAGDAGRRSDPQVRQGPRHHRAAGLRRRADLAADPHARARRRHRRRHAGPRARSHQARHAEARRPARARARRSRRDARHGLRRGSRRDPRGDAEDAADGAVLGDDAGADPVDRAAAPEQPGARDRRAREDRRRQDAARPPDRLHRAARAQAGRARPRARHGEPDVGDRLLPHAARGRDAGRDAERARPPRRRRCTAAWSSGSATA